MPTPHENYWKLRLAKVQKALEANYYGASIHDTLTQAEDYLMKTILPECGAKSVGFGGSATLAATGLVAKLQAVPGLKVINRNDTTVPPEVRWDLSRQTLLVDLFIASTNALTINGELLNLDKFGNRVAAIAFGPNKVALLVGRNKVCDSVDDAWNRVKAVASPLNAMRLNMDTPCAKTAQCADCHTPSRICGVWTITERSFPQKRIHVLLINEDLGF